MKNGRLLLVGVAMFAALSCLPLWALDFSLPVFTVRYETAAGESEDPDEQTMLPSSARNMVSLRIGEDVGTAGFNLTLRASAKDYYLQSGDYSYLEATHEGDFDIGKLWSLGYNLGLKSVGYAELDSEGLPKDTLSLKAGTTASFQPVKGTTLEAGLGGRFALAENTMDSLQAWVMTAGVSSRIGEWLFGVRFRGEYRVALGAESLVTARSYNSGSVSFQWDPNR